MLLNFKRYRFTCSIQDQTVPVLNKSESKARECMRRHCDDAWSSLGPQHDSSRLMLSQLPHFCLSNLMLSLEPAALNAAMMAVAASRATWPQFLPVGQ